MTKAVPSTAVLRAFRSHQQGLDGSLAGRSPAEVLARTGWVRSVGGASPYLALFARAGTSRADADAAVAALAIHELASARGCTYVVPAEDYALALRAGQGRGEAAEINMAKKHCDVTDAEIDKLCKAVLRALGDGPRDPRELKDVLGEKVRHLGETGKKRGLTTTLPLAIGLLQSRGEIRRVPLNGRLDQQRYAYAIWKPGPLAGVTLSDEEVAVALARRFYRWAGPATPAELGWWAGLGVKAAKAAGATLDLVPVGEGDARLMLREDREALLAFERPKEPCYRLVGSLDNIAHPRREVASLLSDANAALEVWNEKKRQAAGTLSDLPNHAIVDRGELVGLWDYDPQTSAVVWKTFGKATAALKQEIARVEAFIRDDLGDARAFSLDSPETRVSRLEALRAAKW
ncbi:MAG: crosslink repair DNA glycosylase YcaQ family protein [Minicystis sp.]